MTKIKNYLLGYENLYIYQDNQKFNFSLDSVLLANFVTINEKSKSILDIGCGNAPIPLILSTRTKANIIGVEIQNDSFDLAVESVNLNNLNNQIHIINKDIKDVYKKSESDIYDCITCNPPYFKLGESSNLNDNIAKTLARHEMSLKLEDVFVIAKKLLKNKGNIAIVHRPERMIEIIELMRRNNIEPKKIQFIYPKKDKCANILLIEGVKNGKNGIKIMPPIYAHNNDGTYTENIKKYFG